MSRRDLTKTESPRARHLGDFTGALQRLPWCAAWPKARILLAATAMVAVLLGSEMLVAVLAIGTEIGELVWGEARER